MSEKQPKLKFEEEKERTATRSPPKKSKVEQSVPKKQKLKQDADKAAEKSQHLRFGKAEITPDEASRMTKQQKRAMYAAAAARSAAHREIDQYERKQAEEDAKKAAEKAAASGSEQTGGNKVTKYAATFLGVLALVGLVAGGGIYTFMKQKQKKQAEKEALDPDANYTEDKGDFEIPVEDEPEETGEEDNAEE